MTNLQGRRGGVRAAVAALILVLGLPDGPTAGARGQARARGSRPRVPTGRWLGQDGRDLVGPTAGSGPNGVQDIHIALQGLPAGNALDEVLVRGLGGCEWRYVRNGTSSAAALERKAGATTAELFLEPFQVETGRGFSLALRFDDGRSLEFWVKGGTADPNRRMPGAALLARWRGQVKHDRTGPGPAVGPDGRLDACLVLEHLPEGVEVKAATLEGPGLAWAYGVNPKGVDNAELVRDPNDSTRAALFFQPGEDLQGARLTLAVAYGDGKTDTATLVAGAVDPKVRVPEPKEVGLASLPIEGRWVGQEGHDFVGAGDVEIALKGLPKGRTIVAAELNDPARHAWAWRGSDRVDFHADSYAEPMVVRQAPGETTAGLYFPPLRDESESTLVLRLALDDGRLARVNIAGGPCRTGLRVAGPKASKVRAKPGDDLNDLANRFGRITLARGTYRLDRPLVLENAVTINGEPGATLLFAQPADAPPWTAAIKVHAGRTTLDGFAVRFAGPVRWDGGVSGGPAVIGSTDERDTGEHPLKVETVLQRLDVEAPPATGEWEPAPCLIRMQRTAGGTIAENRLKGGMIDLDNGPWKVVDNDYQGTVVGTYCHAFLSVRRAHDLVVRGNRVRPEGPSGRTWRFLVLTASGSFVEVADNEVSGIGPRDGDTVDMNAAELLLTESYRLQFEGRPLALTDGGSVLHLPELPSPEVPRSGDIVSILNGPNAGEFRRVAQALGPTTLLLGRPLPAGDYDVAIATGFVNVTIQGNTIDARGSMVACPLVLVGNHYGTKVLQNHLLGGGGPFKLTAAPTESPVHWGWSHAPFLGVTIAGNTFEDPGRGGVLAVEHAPPVKSSRGRTYMKVLFKDNTFRWTERLPAPAAGSPPPDRVALQLGDPGSLDPSELFIAEIGTVVSLPKGDTSRPVLSVHSAHLNNQDTRERLVSLLPPPPPPDRPAAAPPRSPRSTPSPSAGRARPSAPR